MDVKTGQDLFIIVNEGQSPAFTEFYTQYFRKLLLVSEKYVKDIFIAEEIVQDVFLKIWENPERLPEVHTLKPYLYRSVINASINHINRQKTIAEHHLKISAELTEDALNSLDEENELVLLLHQEINKLPAQCQKIFKLNRFERLKYREIALMLDISERTVENHISLALKTLRAAFLSKKGDDRANKRYDLLAMLFLY